MKLSGTSYFLVRITPIGLILARCEFLPGEIAYHELTGEELEQFHLWLLLQQALDSEDTAKAERYRRYLAQSTEQLLAAFLAIDENSVPDYAHAPKRTNDYGIQCTLYRTQFRSTRQAIERQSANGTLRPGDHADMRMWVDTFAVAV